MAQCRAMGRNAVSILFLTFLLFYIAYFTSELYARLNNIRKLERLNAYERELTELTQLLQQYKGEAHIVGESVALLEEVITKMAEASRRRRNKPLTREGANHARQDDIERQLRILDKPLSFLGDRAGHGKAGQAELNEGLSYAGAGLSNPRGHRSGGGEHRSQAVRNSDPSAGGEDAYVSDKMDNNYNSEDLQTNQFVNRNSRKYESLLGDKLANVNGRNSMRQNSVR